MSKKRYLASIALTGVLALLCGRAGRAADFCPQAMFPANCTINNTIMPATNLKVCKVVRNNLTTYMASNVMTMMTGGATFCALVGGGGVGSPWTFSARRPTMNPPGTCTISGSYMAGGSGTFSCVIDSANDGLPVELMEFSVETATEQSAEPGPAGAE